MLGLLTRHKNFTNLVGAALHLQEFDVDLNSTDLGSNYQDV